MKVIIIGSGNVAQVFGRAISATSHELAGFVCRRPEQFSNLKNHAQVPVYGLGIDIPMADLYIAAVSDDYLPNLHRDIKLTSGIIVHTAGSVSTAVLKGIRPDYGSLYPLQSLRKEVDQLPVMPLLIDGSDEKTFNNISLLANEMSAVVRKASDSERYKLHLAAVSSSNFINYMLSLVYDYCEKEGTDPDLLLPLLQETLNRLKHVKPEAVQTGPAIRNDEQTILRHLESLHNYPALKMVYEHFTGLIRKHYHH